MNCKQQEARLTCLHQDGNPRRPPPEGAPSLDPRAARAEVSTRGGTRLGTVIEGWDGDVIWVRIGGTRIPLRWVRVDGTCGFALPSGRVIHPAIGPRGRATEVLIGGQNLFVGPAHAGAHGSLREAVAQSSLAARMDGRVVRVLVRPGERVGAGQPLVVLEAMKMEDALRAPTEATVREVRVTEGDRVRRDQTLVVLDPRDDSR